MAGTEQLRDEYTLGLNTDDKASPKLDQLKNTLDGVTKAAASAAEAVQGAGVAAEGAATKVTAASAAWDRVARRNDDVTAAAYRLKSAQEELARVQDLANKAMAEGGANQDQANRVLQRLADNVDRLKLSLVQVRDAQAASTQAQQLWQNSLAAGDELLTGLAASAAQTAAAFTRGSAEAAVYGQSLDSLRARFDSVFRTSQQYEQELALLNKAFAQGAITGPQAQARALDELNAKYNQSANGTDALIAKNNSLRASFDPLFAATEKYNASMLSLGDAISRGILPGLAEQSAALAKIVADYERATEAATGAKAAAEAAASAGQSRANSFANVQAPTSQEDYAKREADIAAFGDSLSALQARFDPLYAANQKFIEGTTALALAIRSGLLPTIELQEAALAKLVAEHEEATAAIRGTAAAAEAFQAKANAFAGVQAPTSEEDYAKRAADIQAYGSALDALRAKFDPLFAVSKAYEVQFNELNAAVAKGALPASQYNAALDRLNAGFAKTQAGAQGVTVSHGQAAFAVRQLGVQTTQFFSSLESGIPFMTALVEQGHQVVDVALATGTGFGVFRDAAVKAFAAITSPVGLAITSITLLTAGLVAMTYATENSQKTLLNLQSTLRATREDYVGLATDVNNAAKAAAATSPVSRTDARAAGAVIAGSASFAGSQDDIANLIKLSNDLATVWGVKVPDAAKTLAKAMEDPAKVADELAKQHFPGMTTELARTIERMQNSGDASGAFSQVLGVLKTASGAATDAMTPLGAALERLEEKFASTKTAADNLTAPQGPLTRLTTNVLNATSDLVDKLNGIGKSGEPNQMAMTPQQMFGGVPQAPAAPDSFAARGGADPGNAKLLAQQAEDAAKAVDDFIKVMDKANAAVKDSPFGKLQDAGDKVTAFKGAIADLGEVTDENSKQFGTLSQALQIAQKALDEAQIAAAHYFDTATDKSVTSIEAQAKGQREIAEAYANGSDAIVQATAQAKAYEAALSEGLIPGTDRFNDAVVRLTAANLDLARSTGAVKAAEDARNIAGQIELINAETRAIIDNSAANRDAIVAIKNRQAAQKEADTGATPDDQAHALAARIQLEAADAAKSTATLAQSLAGKFKPAEIEDYTQKIKQMQDALIQLGPRTQENAKEFDLYSNAIKGGEAEIAKLEKTTATHVAALDKQKDTVLAQIDATDKLTVAWSKGNDQVVLITAQLKAQEKAISDGLKPGTDKYAAAVATLTNEFLRLGQSQANLKAVQESNDIQQQIKLVQLETTTLFDNNDARTLKIQHMKDEYDVAKNNMSLAPAAQQALLAEKDALAAISQELTNKQQTLTYLQQQFTSAFDSIGNAMTQAFVQGSGSAVKWGNVMQGVLTQVVQMFAHLAILNPIMNGLFGQNQPTLNSVAGLFGGQSTGGAGALGTALQIVNVGGKLQLIGGGGGGGVGVGGAVGGVGGISSLIGTQDIGAIPGIGGAFGGGTIGGLAGLYASGAGQGVAAGGVGGGSSLLSTGGNLITGIGLLDKLGFTNIGGQFSGITNSLGITGPGGLFSGSGSGLLGGVSSFLDTPLISGVGTQFGPVTAGLASEGAGIPAALSVGSLIGGVGAGYGVGSLVGGFVQSSLGKVGPGPEIGAATGAIAGAVIGSVVPVIGTLAGALIGGVIGGGGGGLIGPKAPSAFSSTMVTINDQGLLQVGGTTAQRVDASAERSGALSDAASVNQILTQRNLRVTSLAGGYNAPYFQIGQNTPGGFQDPSKFANLGAEFPNLRFSSQDPTTQAFIKGRAFASPEELAGVTTSLADFVNALKGTKAEADTTGLALRALSGAANTDVQGKLQDAATFLTATYPTLMKGNVGSLQTAQEAVNAQYGPAIQKARDLGFGADDLTAAQQRLYDKNNKAAADAIDATANSVNSRYLTARATVTGSSQDALTAQLVAFDTNAKQQHQQLSDTLLGIWGDAAATSADYQNRMAEDDKATAEERLAIQVQYNKQTEANLIASTEQLLTLQARRLTSAAALTGDPRQMQAASVNALRSQQTIENVDFNRSEQQTFGDAFATADVQYADKIRALQESQNNEMALLQQQIDRTNLQLQISSDQQNQAISVRGANANAALNPSVAPQAALYSFDVQAQQEQQNLYLSLTATYGNAYALTQQYADKLTALQQTQGEERLVLEQTLHDRQMQLDISNAQQDAAFATRVTNARAAISGTPADAAAAQTAALYNQQLAEQQNLMLQLTSTYGDAFQYTQAYRDKLNELANAQAYEAQALQQQIALANLQRDISSQQQNAGFATRLGAAQAAVTGSPTDQANAQRASLAAQQQAEQQNLYLSLVQTYGSSYLATKEYADKVAALTQAQQAEAAALEVQIAQAATQRAVASQQQDIGVATRLTTARATLSGSPADQASAQLAALAAQQQTEIQNQYLSLVQTYGASYIATKEYADKVAALVQTQQAEAQVLQQQIDRANLERSFASQQQDVSFAVRYGTAAAQVSGGPAAQNAAALAAFDAQAQAEQQNLYLSLTSTYGMAYAATQEYADKLTALQKAQGEERLALQVQQDDALRSQASASIASLNQYALSLQTGSQSPLSPQAQLDLAQRQFDIQSNLAAGGDFTAVQSLQQYSSAYLSAAQNVYGGASMDYVQAFGKVITALATVGAETPDTLTASILQTETRTQTEILVEQLQELQDEVKALRLELAQGTAAPARVAGTP